MISFDAPGDKNNEPAVTPKDYATHEQSRNTAGSLFSSLTFKDRLESYFGASKDYSSYLESKGYRYEGDYTIWEPLNELPLDDFDTSQDCEELYTIDYTEEF